MMSQIAFRRILLRLTMAFATLVLMNARVANAAPNCDELARHAFAQLQSKASCRELGAELNRLKAEETTCGQVPEVQTQHTLLQAALREERCSCEELDAAIGTARARAPEKLSCPEALTTLARLRNSRGACQNGRSLAVQQDLEKKLAARRDASCGAECASLVEQVTKAKCEGVAQEAWRCAGCGEAEAGACRRVCNKSTAAVPTDDSNLVGELYQLLGSLNSRISNEPNCAQKSEPCRDLEQDRLRTLTSFLRLLHDARLTKESRAHFQDEALKVLRVMGIQASMLDYLRLHSPEELNGMSELSKVVSNQELRGYLVAQLGPLKDQRLQPMLDALRSGASLETLFATAQAMTPDARAEFYQTAGAVGIREAGIRQDYLQEIVNAGLDLILPASATQTNCNNCGHFWGKLQGELNASQRIGIISANDVVTELGKRLEQRSKICSGQLRGAAGPGCGPVLAVVTTEQSDGSLLIKPLLRYVIRSGTSALVNELSLGPQVLAGNATQQDQESEARALAASAIYRFNQLLATPYRSQLPAVELAPCGASVSVDQNPDPAPRSGGQLSLRGSACHLPAFKQTLLEKLAAHGVSRRLTFDWGDAASGNASGSARTTPDQPLQCQLTVLAPNGNNGIVPAYSLSTVVFDAPGCTTQRDERFAYVARQAAWQMAAYFSNVVVADTKPKSPPYLHALYFSGARQLEYSKGERGWEWAAGEAGLLAVGAGLAVLAVNARNQSPGTAADTQRANAFLDAAYVSFGLVIPLRLIAGKFCCGDER
jgi:hypothetical protein